MKVISFFQKVFVVDILPYYVAVKYCTEIQHASSEGINVTVSNALASNSAMD